MGETSFDVNNKRINVNLGPIGTNLSVMAHEFRHGYGYLNGELLGAKGTDPLYDIMDEVVVVNAGHLFLDKKTAAGVANGRFNLDWFKSTAKSKGDCAALVGRKEQLTTNTSAADFIKYNPSSKISFVVGFKNNSNMTLMQAIDFLNK